MAGLKPDAVVLVATIRALKYNGGVPKDELSSENLDALKAGIVNLEKHIENLHKFGVPVVVTLNSFVTDTKAETDFVEQFCKERGCEFALSEVWEKGGEGGIDLANKVLETIEHKESNFKVLYDDSLSLKEKIETVAKKYMEQMVLHILRQQRENSRGLQTLEWAIFQYVWQRHSIRFLMMQRSLADRAALKSTYVRFMRQQVQALW